MTIEVPIIDGMQWMLGVFSLLAVGMVLKWLWSWITG